MAAEEGSRTSGKRNARASEPLDIESVRGPRVAAQADRRTERESMAQTAREVAAHLLHVANQLDKYPVKDHELAKYRALIDATARATPTRRKLAKERRKMVDEPFTLEELREGWTKPLGGLAASWTQVFNRSEFADDRDAMVSVTNVLCALSCAFWEDKKTRPHERSAAGKKLLGKLGSIATPYLSAVDERRDPLDRCEQLVERHADAVIRLAEMLGEQLHAPFFVMQKDRERPFKRVALSTGALDALAIAATERLIDVIDNGYAFAEVKAAMPPDFTSAASRSAVRATIYEFLLMTFYPGSEEAGAFDTADAIWSAKSLLKKVLKALRYKRPVGSIFDAHDKRAKK